MTSSNSFIVHEGGLYIRITIRDGVDIDIMMYACSAVFDTFHPLFCDVLSSLIYNCWSPVNYLYIIFFTYIETSAYIGVPPSTVTVAGRGIDPIRASDEWSYRYNS